MIKNGKMGLLSVFFAPETGTGSMPSFPSMSGNSATDSSTTQGQAQQTEQSPGGNQDQQNVGKEAEGSSTMQDNEKKEKDGFYPWTNVLPDKYKKDDRFKGFKNISEFLGSVLPDDTAEGETKAQEGEIQSKTAEYKDFNKKLAQPEDPKGTRSKLLLDSLQKYGVPQSEAEKIFDSFNNSMMEDAKTIIQDNTVLCQKTLAKEWGAEAQTKQNLAERAFTVFANENPEIGKELQMRGILTVPAFWKALSIIGSNLSEDNPISSRQSPKTGTFDKSTIGRLIPDFPKIN